MKNQLHLMPMNPRVLLMKAAGRVFHPESWLCFYCSDKYHHQNQLGKEGVSYRLQCVVSHEGKSGQEPQGSESSDAYWLVLHDLFSLLFYSTQDYLPSCGTAVGCSLSHRSSAKKMPERPAFLLTSV